VHFREDKATQAASRIIDREGGVINIMKLVKLLYLTDREALIQWGRPITFDAYYSLPRGPIVSNTLDLINDVVPFADGTSYWHTYISERRNNSVSLIGKTPNDMLSEAEESLIDEIYHRFGNKSEWDLVDLTHDLPEYRKPPDGSRLPIDIADILTDAGFTPEEIEDVKKTLEYQSLPAEF